MTPKHSRLVLIPLVTLFLASCAGEGPSGADGSDLEVPAQEYVHITDQQGSLEEFVGAGSDATVERCAFDSSRWIAEGAVANPTDESQSYRLYVAFNKNRDTQGLVQVDIESIAPGASQGWQVEAPISGDGLDCVLRVERFAPQG